MNNHFRYLLLFFLAAPVPEHNLITIYQQSPEGTVTAADTTAVEVVVSGEDLLGPSSAKKKRKDDTRCKLFLLLKNVFVCVLCSCINVYRLLK